MAILRPETHVTGDGGERLFEFSIPRRWPSVKQTADYGIDFYVQVAEAHRVTGTRFGAQVKTTGRHRRVGENLRVTVEVRHLEYWLDEEHAPVLLVACELEEPAAAYYVDVDEAAKELPSGWRNQDSVTLSVPSQNRVTDHERLLDDVRRAAGRRHSPGAAIATRKRVLERLDPRFAISILATESGEFVRLTARERVETTFRLTGPEERTDRLLRGHKIEVGPGEAEFDNMPLLRTFCETGGSMSVGARAEAALSFIATVGESEARIANIPVIVIRAPRALRMELSSPVGVPLRFEFERRIGDGEEDEPDTPPTATFEIDPRAWAGQSLRQLQLFEATKSFVEKASRGALVRIIVHLLGNDVPIGEQLLPEGSFANVLEFLQVIELARAVSVEQGIDPKLPPAFSPRDEEDIRRAHGLVFRGEYRAPGRAWTFSVTGVPDGRINRGLAGNVEIRSKASDGLEEELPMLDAKVPVRLRQVVLTAAALSKTTPLASGDTRYAFQSDGGEFIQRSDRYPGPLPDEPSTNRRLPKARPRPGGRSSKSRRR